MSAIPHDPILLQVSHLIEQRTGLAANAQLHAELNTVLRHMANDNPGQLIESLRQSTETSPLWQRLLQALTIGETYFFRDSAHFQRLRQQILPGLILARRRQGLLQLDIWSAGCASGEETYSLAILLTELLPDLPDWTIRLIGTDINADALENAHQGIYRNWSFRHTGDSFQKRYFARLEGGWQIKPEIRAMVDFRPGNLLNQAVNSHFDIILCRNVLIYFAAEAVEAVEDYLLNALTSGGWLILGQSESIRFERERWITHIYDGTMLYQKPTPGTKQHPTLLYQASNAKTQSAQSYADAVHALRADQVEKARDILHQLVEKQTSHAEAHTLLASIFANRQQWQEAHTHLDAALRLNPLLADAHYLRAVVFLEEGRTDEVQQELKATLYSQHQHPLAAFMLGNLQIQLGAIDKAIRLWENTQQMIKVRPPDSYLSDLSDITAFGLDVLITRQLTRWKP